MKNPSHPGRIVRNELDYRKLSVAEAANALGITRHELNSFLTGENAVSSKMALRLQQTIGGSAQMWLRMQANYDSAQVRRNRPNA